MHDSYSNGGAPTANLTAEYHAIGAISIPWTHYYLVNDVNGNGELDTDEQVWLVLLRYNGGAPSREYYRFTDLNNDGHVDDGELSLAPEASPDVTPIKARWTNADGSVKQPNAQEELENFVQWFVWHRKRHFVGMNAVGTAIMNFSGVNAGVYSINNYNGARFGVTSVDDTDGNGLFNEKKAILDRLYAMAPVGSTPLLSAYNDVGKYFDQTISDDISIAPITPSVCGATSANPFCDADHGGACQQSFAIVMTDGYYTSKYNVFGNVDGGNDSEGIPYQAPYRDSYSGTMADLAMHYYDMDLAPSLDDQIPSVAFDKNSRQHLVTYTLAFGVTGATLLTDMNMDGTPDLAGCNYQDDPYFLNQCTRDNSPTWQDANTDPRKIDDMWHASINGRGLYFSASNPQELTDAMKSISADISSREASGAAAAVNGSQITSGSAVYIGHFNTDNWTGGLFSYRIGRDPITGKSKIFDADGEENWSAATILQARTPDSRLIVTSNGDGLGLNFVNAAPGLLDNTVFTEAQREMLGRATSEPTVFGDLIPWLRGQNDIATMRKRGGEGAGNNILGDIIHSAPVMNSTAIFDRLDNNGNGRIDETAEQQIGTIFVGANDGMLHAFDAETGEERFAFIPSLTHDHLLDLSAVDYQHRYYLDAGPVVTRLARMAGDMSADRLDNNGDGQGIGNTIDASENYGDGIDNDHDGVTDESGERANMYLLVSGLGRGGKGYFALDVTNADSVANASQAAAMVQWEYPRRSTVTTSIDTNGDGIADKEASENTAISYTYKASAADGRDNNGDGAVDESDEKALYVTGSGYEAGVSYCGGDGNERLAYCDDDLGYSYSTPAVVKSYRSKYLGSQPDNSSKRSPWLAIFGNGYESYNGKAMLYILDALSGEVIRKIDTGVGNHGNPNGLSSPVVIDVDEDDRVDYAYAGDLQGNLWKFDLTDSDPSNWRIAHENAAHQPQAMFSAPGQAITARPDVMYHCAKAGYMVTFGTGQFLGEPDRASVSQQSLFGIWDYDSVPDNGIDDDGDGAIDEMREIEPIDRRAYLGVWNRSANSFANAGYNRVGAKLTKQEVIWQGMANGNDIRVTSDNKPVWYGDNDGGGGVGHEVGWYLDLPGLTSMTNAAAERVVKDVQIRDGKLIAVSFIPNDTECSAGGKSVLMEVSACAGARLDQAQLDINGDGKIDSGDFVTITLPDGSTATVAANGIAYDGMVNTPNIVRDPDNKTEVKIMPGSGGLEVIDELSEEAGANYWREPVNN
ncbi:MAG: hypothetical protein LBU39_00640 [Desulfobulbaceae bacterium]|nr:hypothetical protein [Desulfobulbaceae bacterium]